MVKATNARAAVRAFGAGIMLLAAAVGAPSSANIFDVDDRVPMKNATQSGEPYVPIGRYQSLVPLTDGKGGEIPYPKGTAFLVSPCYIITNYHVVYGFDTDGPDRGKEYRGSFLLGSGQAETSTGTTPVMHGNYQARAGGGDWALLKLDVCLGEHGGIGWMEVSTMGAAAMTRQPLMTSGYFADVHLDVLYIDASCRVRSGTTVGLAHDCASRPGASGAPLFGINRSGVPVVVAVNAGPNRQVRDVATFSEEAANYAVSMQEIINTPGVLNLLKPDLERMREGNPSQLRFPPPIPRPAPLATPTAAR